MDIEKELKKIECEEEHIEREEKEIEQREDLLRVFEELGLMRWKSYYILTAGAILLLSLTFVTALWVMHDQLLTIQSSVDSLSSKISSASPAPTTWCPAGQETSMDMGSIGASTVTVVGEELHNGKMMCHVAITTISADENQTVNTWIDKLGNVASS